MSTERLREAPVSEVRRRLRDDSLSSKGFGLVEQGSEETARSLNSASEGRSIWLCAGSDGARETRQLRSRPVGGSLALSRRLRSACAAADARAEQRHQGAGDDGGAGTRRWGCRASRMRIKFLDGCGASEAAAESKVGLLGGGSAN